MLNSKTKSSVVHMVQVETRPETMAAPVSPVRAGDWVAYRYHLAHNHLTLDQGRALCRDVLGTRMRAVPKHSMVFTEALIQQLVTDNQKRRELKWPYFAKAASLYRELALLDENLAQIQN